MPVSHQRTVIFLHIPKNGGSTLHWIIAKQYRPSDIYRLEAPDLDYQKSINEFKKIPAIQKQNIKLLMGHMGFGLHQFIPQSSTYITMFREPVDRVVSFYYFARLKAKKDDNLSLKDFILKGGSKQVNNGQTRLLASLDGSFDDNVAYGICTDEMLVRAKENLQTFFCGVGLLENFDASILYFRRELGWKLPFYVKNNVNKERPETCSLTTDIIDVIREYNTYDLELYEFAKNIFVNKINKLGPSFQRELNLFKSVNSIFDRIYCSAQMIYSYHTGKRKIR